MDYDKLIEELNNWNEYTIVELCGIGKMPCQTHCDNERCIVSRTATAIETLCAENKRLRADWEKYQPREHWETLNEAVDNLRADLARVTAERDEAVKKYEAEKEDFLDYALSGTPNATPFCRNRHPDCVDKRGWCIPVKCHGFSRNKED